MIIFSLKQTLNNLRFALPVGFDASNGIGSLLPNRPVSITALNKLARVRLSATLFADDVICTAVVEADSDGRWGFAANVHDKSRLVGHKYAVGFAFNFQPDKAHGKIMHGTVNSKFFGGQDDNPKDGGVDPFIKDNWPQAFNSGIRFDLKVSTDPGQAVEAGLAALVIGALAAATALGFAQVASGQGGIGVEINPPKSSVQ